MASPWGASGATCPLPPPPTSDRTSREIDADQRRFSYPKKWGLVYRICSDVLHAPTLRWTFFGLTITKKEGVVEVVEGVTLVGLNSEAAGSFGIFQSWHWPSQPYFFLM